MIALTRADHAALLQVTPRTPDQLHAWLGLALDLDVPRRPLLPAHASPFDYLVHAYFEAGPTRDCVVWANRGGGKTFLAAVATLLDLVFKPSIDVRILAGSLEQAQRMHEHLRRLFDRPALADLLDGRVTARRVRLLNGSSAHVLAASHTSVRGCRPQKLRCDEVELFDPDLWQAAQLVTRSRRCGGVLVRAGVEALSTMHRPHGLMATLVSSCAQLAVGIRTPPTLLRWGVVDVLARCEPERPCEPCPLLPECARRAKRARGHVEIDDAVAMKMRVSLATWEAEMLCLRPRRDDMVLPEFDRAIHVADFDAPARTAPPPPADPLAPVALHAPPSPAAGGLWVAGMDFGFRAPTVILWGHLDASGLLRVVDERVEREAVLSKHVESLLRGRWPRPAWVGVDPAGRQRSDQTGLSSVGALERAGLTVRARPAPLETGLGLLRARLRPASGPPRLLIHARCRTLVESLERYHYPHDRPEALTPVKDGADHAVDALRYLVVSLDRPATTRMSRYA